MKWKLSFTLILLFALRVICKKMTIRLLTMNSTVNPEYMKYFSMVIKPDRESVDMDLMVTRALDKNLRSFVSVSGHLRCQKNSTPEFQFDLPICDIINNGMKAKNQIITNSIRNLFKQGNVPAKCPIQAGNYSWRGLRPRKEHMSTFTQNMMITMSIREKSLWIKQAKLPYKLRYFHLPSYKPNILLNKHESIGYQRLLLIYWIVAFLRCI